MQRLTATVWYNTLVHGLGALPRHVAHNHTPGSIEAVCDNEDFEPMSFLSNPSFLSTLRRCAWGAGVLFFGALAAGCGGGAKQIEPFVPKRLVAFGDENSVILADGRKYTVNAVVDGRIDCTTNVIWVQKLANSLGIPLRECPLPAAAGATALAATSFSRAAAGATVNDVSVQIDNHLAADTLGDKDLVTIYVGLHNIVQGYEQLATSDEATITAALQAQGKTLGEQVNRVAQTGAPVLVVTVPNLGDSPYGRAQQAATPGSAALLGRLTSSFNIAMRLEIINDGRLVGLVDAFDLTRAAVTAPSLFLLTNIIDASCAAATPTPDCSTATLAEVGGVTASATGFMWADGLHLGPSLHDRLGDTALGRARNNPF